MPDLSILVELADYYDIEIKEPSGWRKEFDHEQRDERNIKQSS